MHILQPVPKHGSVDLVEKILIDPNHVIGSNAKKIAIVCSVVKLAERESVINSRESAQICVGEDVSGIQKIRMFEETHGAGRRVRAHHLSSENGLMEPLLYEAFSISALIKSHRHWVAEKAE